jgi:hypothetical protein
LQKGECYETADDKPRHFVIPLDSFVDQERKREQKSLHDFPSFVMHHKIVSKNFHPSEVVELITGKYLTVTEGSRSILNIHGEQSSFAVNVLYI